MSFCLHSASTFGGRLRLQPQSVDAGDYSCRLTCFIGWRFKQAKDRVAAQCQTSIDSPRNRANRSRKINSQYFYIALRISQKGYLCNRFEIVKTKWSYTLYDLLIRCLFSRWFSYIACSQVIILHCIKDTNKPRKKQKSPTLKVPLRHHRRNGRFCRRRGWRN